MQIHPTAIVDPGAELADDVVIGPWCVIEKHVRVASGVRLYHNVYLTGWTEIGEDCVIHPGAIVGHEPQDLKHTADMRSFCRVGPRTIIRENATIHRGTEPDSETRIGADCFLMGNIHIAHNCQIGDRVIMTNNVALAGHVQIEDRVTIGGGTVIHQFVRVGELVMIRGGAALGMDIIPFSIADRFGKVSGLNTIGLRRAEVSSEARKELQRALHTLYDLKLGSFEQRVARLASTAESPVARQLVAFLKSESKRGFAGRRRSNDDS